MNVCPKEEILQAYLDGELTASVGEDVFVHLATCAYCATAMEEMMRAFDAISSAFAVELPDTTPTRRLRVRIESALAEQAVPRLAWATWFRRLSWATAMLLIAGLIGWAWLGRHSSRTPQQANHKLPAPMGTPAVTVKSEFAQQTSRVRHHPRNPARNHYAAVTESVTEFYPLREGDDLTALDTLQLMRVELPSSALSDVGLPVSVEAMNARVKADVVLGEDGLARAIRFVR